MNRLTHWTKRINSGCSCLDVSALVLDHAYLDARSQIMGGSSQDEVSKWSIAMVIVRPPRPGVVGPLPRDPFISYKWG